MKYRPINFKDKLSRFSEHWSQKVIAEMNDYQFKVAKLQGEFVWHDHQDTDETFIVPAAKEECKVLLVEPRGVVNTGEAGGDLTAANDVWI